MQRLFRALKLTLFQRSFTLGSSENRLVGKQQAVEGVFKTATRGASEYSLHTFVKSLLQKVRDFRHLWKTKWD